MKAHIKYGILEQARHVKQAQNRGDSRAQIKPQTDATIAVTTQIRKEAAVKVRKLKVGKVPWEDDSDSDDNEDSDDDSDPDDDSDDNSDNE